MASLLVRTTVPISCEMRGSVFVTSRHRNRNSRVPSIRPALTDEMELDPVVGIATYCYLSFAAFTILYTALFPTTILLEAIYSFRFYKFTQQDHDFA